MSDWELFAAASILLLFLLEALFGFLGDLERRYAIIRWLAGIFILVEALWWAGVIPWG